MGRLGVFEEAPRRQRLTRLLQRSDVPPVELLLDLRQVPQGRCHHFQTPCAN